MFNEKALYGIIFGLIQKVFIEFLPGLINTSYHTKCVSLSNHKCINPATLINLHPNECNQ